MSTWPFTLLLTASYLLLATGLLLLLFVAIATSAHLAQSTRERCAVSGLVLMGVGAALLSMTYPLTATATPNGPTAAATTTVPPSKGAWTACVDPIKGTKTWCEVQLAEGETERVWYTPPPPASMTKTAP